MFYAKKNPITDISISNEVLVIFSYTPIYCLRNTLSDLRAHRQITYLQLQPVLQPVLR